MKNNNISYRQLFFSNEHEKDFSEHGYFIVRDKIPSNTIQKLYDYFNSLSISKSLKLGFSTPFDYYGIEKRYEIHDFITKNLLPLITELYVDCEVYLSNYMIKTPEENFNIDVHQDWSYVDETQNRTFNIWIPLTDTTLENGSMVLLPKSHFANIATYRAPSVPFYFDALKELLYNYLQPIELKKGDILIFDNSIIHGATSNNSKENRIAVVLCVKPKETKLQFLYPTSNKLLVFEQENDFIFRFDNYLKEIRDEPKIGVLINQLPLSNLKVRDKKQLRIILESISAISNNNLFKKYKKPSMIKRFILSVFRKDK